MPLEPKVYDVTMNIPMCTAKKPRLRLGLILCFFVLLFQDAHSQHLSFMGIPIDGTIKSFQGKIAAKGFSYDAPGSKIAPAGERKFTGKYNGHKAHLSVFYNRKTDLVYEVEISVLSKKKDDIQSLLYKTMDNINSQYSYIPEHDEKDAKNLHFRFHILDKSEPTGTIHVQPTYALVFDDYGQVSGTEYLLQLNYEDKANMSKLTPSVTKPTGTKHFFAEQPDIFYKSIVWANEFKKAGDIEKEINYLMTALNYYKFGCVPPQDTVTEDEIETEILSAQNNKVGSVPYWNNKTTNVYKCSDIYGSLFYVFSANMGLIKLYKKELSTYITNLSKINDIFRSKIAADKRWDRNEGWREEISSSLVVNYGVDRRQGAYGFGDYHWDRSNIILKLRKGKGGIYVELCSSDQAYMPIMTFGDPAEIDQHINFMKWLLTK